MFVLLCFFRSQGSAPYLNTSYRTQFCQLGGKSLMEETCARPHNDHSSSAVHAWVLSTSRAPVLLADKERAVLGAQLLPGRTEDNMVAEISRTPPFSFLSRHLYPQRRMRTTQKSQKKKENKNKKSSLTQITYPHHVLFTDSQAFPSI